MNTFPLIAALTICLSLAVLTASFDDLRETPLDFEAIARTQPTPPVIAVAAPTRSTLMEANEGLSDLELASADPIQAWLDRTLTPPADYIPPRD